MASKIIEIVTNIKTGTVLIKTTNNKRRRSLYEDKYGYFCRDKKFGDRWLVDRFLEPEDIEKIKKHIS